MVKYDAAVLDKVFAALADPTRRAVLDELDAGAMSVGTLATMHDMSLPGFLKHLAVLEAAGLIARSKEGRVVRCALDAAPLQEAAMWLARYERFWNERLDALGRYLFHQQEIDPCQNEQAPTPPPPPPPPTPRPSSSGATTPPRPTKSGAPGRTRKR